MKKLTKEASLIRQCIRYMETMPDELFLNSTLDKLKKGIEIHKQRATVWAGDKSNLVKFKDSKHAVQGYLKMVDIATMIAKKETLEYLLNKN